MRARGLLAGVQLPRRAARVALASCSVARASIACFLYLPCRMCVCAYLIVLCLSYTLSICGLLHDPVLIRGAAICCEGILVSCLSYHTEMCSAPALRPFACPLIRCSLLLNGSSGGSAGRLVAGRMRASRASSFLALHPSWQRLLQSTSYSLNLL